LVSDREISAALEAARAAGQAILPFYQQALDVFDKGDGSPLTVADQAAHRAICERLAPTGVPVVSEEGGDLRMELDRYWLVDPLDGTKDFLVANGEFTVNVAMVEGDRTIFGVVSSPASDRLWFGGEGHPAAGYVAGRLVAAAHDPVAPVLRVAVSRFHDHPDVDVFINANVPAMRVPMGSALKYCQLASADVDVFPRLVGCSEWDTAAGQAIVEAAGGRVLDWHTGLPLRYGKRGRRNPRLLSFRAPYVRESFRSMEYAQELL